MDENAKGIAAKEVQIPEWEHVAAKDIVQTKPGFSFRRAFDTALPPQKKYLGLRRKWFLWILLAIVLVALILIIGLTLGLRQHKNNNLPLPTNGSQFTGDLTYFQTGLGACGWTTTDADMIVSMSHILFDAAGSSTDDGGNSNANPLCGKMIRAQRYNEAAGGTRSVDLKVVDRCTGCEQYDIDTTTAAFEQLAPIADGRVEVTWAWL